MKKLLLISFLILWVSTTSVITAALLKNDNAAAVVDTSTDTGEIQETETASNVEQVADETVDPNVSTTSTTNTKQTTAPASKTTQTVKSTGITAATVAKHNKANDCWSIIDKKVYNLTSLTSTHSGGSNPIVSVCGKDGTAKFNSFPHSASAKNALSKYFVGNFSS